MVRATYQLLQEADGCNLGLWGMHGLGKTTLARALCASLRRKFLGRTCLLEFHSHVSDGDLDRALAVPHICTALAQLGHGQRGDETARFDELSQASQAGQHMLAECLTAQCSHRPVMQRLGRALEQQPRTAVQEQRVLLVIDNVSCRTQGAAQLILDLPRASGSLVLVTAWNPTAINSLRPGQQCSTEQQSGFTVRSMAAIEALTLQPAEAQRILQSQLTAHQPAEQPQHQPHSEQLLASLAEKALAFSSAPVYVPQVLVVCGRALAKSEAGGTRGDAVNSLLQQLTAATEPGQLQGLESTVFEQLRICYRQLSGEARLMFQHLAMASQSHAAAAGSQSAEACWGSRVELDLWLSSRQPDLTMEDAHTQVRGTVSGV